MIKNKELDMKIDDVFFQLDWAGACWGCWAGLQALDVAFLCKKNKKEEGPVGALPVTASMPKLVSL